MPLMKNVHMPISKNILVPLGLPAAVSATDTAIQKKIHSSETTALMISNEEMENSRKIVKSLAGSKNYKKL